MSNENNGLTNEEMKIWASTLEGAARYANVLLDGLSIIRPFKSKSVEVAGIDQYWRVALGDKFFTYNKRERIGILIHECLHVVCNHHAREAAARQTDHELSNLAQDFEINQMIMSLPGVDLPPEAMFPNKHGYHLPTGRTMESYYTALGGSIGAKNQTAIGLMADSVNKEKAEERRRLKDALRGKSQESQTSSQNRKTDSKNDGSSPSGSKDESKSKAPGDRNENNDDLNSASSNKGDASQDSKQGYNGSRFSQGQKSDGDEKNDGNGPGSSSLQATGDGSDSSDGNGGSSNSRFGRMKSSHNNYKSKPQAGMCGNAAEDRIEEEADSMDVDRVSGAMRSKAKEKIEARAKDPYSWGSGGQAKDFALKLASLMHQPKVDWRQVFRRVITNAYSGLSYKRTEYSYRRINRRGNAFMKNIAFPGMVSYTPRALMAIDTSASMHEDELRSSLMEAEGIIRQVGHGSKDSFQAFCVDTKMKNVQTVNKVEDIDLSGGGGTDMAPAFAYAGSLPKRLRPDVFILVTDCGLDWKKVAKVWPQQIKVVILCTSKDGYDRLQKDEAWIFNEAKVIDISDEDDYSYYQGR